MCNLWEIMYDNSRTPIIHTLIGIDRPVLELAQKGREKWLLLPRGHPNRLGGEGFFTLDWNAHGGIKFLVKHISEPHIDIAFKWGEYSKGTPALHLPTIFSRIWKPTRLNQRFQHFFARRILENHIALWILSTRIVFLIPNLQTKISGFKNSLIQLHCTRNLLFYTHHLMTGPRELTIRINQHSLSNLRARLTQIF